jgi:hypothetical protein
MIKSPNKQAFQRNAETLFDENYNLAFTQQKKNKDIPEGGSKGTILLSMVGMNLSHTKKSKFVIYHLLRKRRSQSILYYIMNIFRITKIKQQLRFESTLIQ